MFRHFFASLSLEPTDLCAAVETISQMELQFI